MDNIAELQKDQIVRVFIDKYPSRYEDGIITFVDYHHDMVEVSLAHGRVRMVGVAEIELPR